MSQNAWTAVGQSILGQSPRLRRYNRRSIDTMGLLSGIAAAGLSVFPDNHSIALSVVTIVSTLLFAAAHLPLATVIAGQLNAALASFVMIANSLFGFFAGLLFIAYGLEFAIVAHIIFHLTSMVLEKWDTNKST